MFSTYPDVSSCWQLLNFLLFCRPASFLKDRPHHKSRGNEWPTRAGSLRINWMADDCLYCPSTSKRKLCPFAPLNTQCAAMCRLGFSRPNTIRPKLLADENTSFVSRRQIDVAGKTTSGGDRTSLTTLRTLAPFELQGALAKGKI